MHDPKTFTRPDDTLDLKLRPRAIEDFLGNESIIERLKVIIKAALKRKEPVSHILFHGPPGLGKTTLASIVASEMGTGFISSSGPTIEKAGDLAGILSNLQEGDVFFIDEIHRMQKSIEEYLYPAMEDFMLDLMIDSGTNARSIKVNLPKFTLIGATTKLGTIGSPLRSRFPLSLRLEYYEDKVLSQIIVRSATLLQAKIDSEAAFEIAKRSRGTPRVANNLLRWVRDFASLHNDSKIDLKTVQKALLMIGVDEMGLDEMDKKILEVIIKHHKGGPVGIKSIAASVGEEESTLADAYEPYLIMKGFLRRTPRGRETTDLAHTHLKEYL